MQASSRSRLLHADTEVAKDGSNNASKSTLLLCTHTLFDSCSVCDSCCSVREDCCAFMSQHVKGFVHALVQIPCCSNSCLHVGILQ